MREASLPSPNIGGSGYHLRRIAAKAISEIQISAPRYSGGVHPKAAALSAFFAACKAEADKYKPEE